MSKLARHILQKYPQATAEKILYRNALRVLHCGWKGV
jgi:microsomal dipeptidase-like Zn-dependent dipeptidase